MTDIDDKKLKDLEALSKTLGKKHSYPGLLRVGNKGIISAVDVIPTGSLSLNIATGINGWPRGRIIEIFGPYSSGKTTIVLHAIHECQKAGGIAAFIDMEQSLDLKYARSIGVDTDTLLLSQPDSAEQALDVADMLCKSGLVNLVAIDSVASLVPQAELDADAGKNTVGMQARLMSQFLRRIPPTLRATNTLLIFTNQIRMKIGVIWGNPETTSGGESLKFYASMRVDIRQVGKADTDAMSNKARIRIIKNKLAPPYQEAEVTFLWGQGLDKLGELIDTCIAYEIIDKAGAWLSYKGTRLGQGIQNARDYIDANPDLADKLFADLRDKINLGPLNNADLEATDTDE